MDTTEIVREKLDKLAVLDDPDAIAMELEAQGIKAEPGGAFTCAIARYLGNPGIERPELADGTVAVCSTSVAIYRSGALAETVAVPFEVGSFIRRFDRNEYPALIAEDEQPWREV